MKICITTEKSFFGNSFLQYLSIFLLNYYSLHKIFRKVAKYSCLGLFRIETMARSYSDMKIWMNIYEIFNNLFYLSIKVMQQSQNDN